MSLKTRINLGYEKKIGVGKRSIFRAKLGYLVIGNVENSAFRESIRDLCERDGLCINAHIEHAE